MQMNKRKLILRWNFSIHLSLSCIRFRAWQRRWGFLNRYYAWSCVLIQFDIEILLVKLMQMNKWKLFVRRNFSIPSSLSCNRFCAWQRKWIFKSLITPGFIVIAWFF